MLVAVIKKILPVMLSLTALAFTPNTVNAESAPSLEELKRLAIDLRREIQETEDKLANLDKNSLSIYLNIDNIPKKYLQDIEIKLGDQTISKLTFDDKEYDSLSKGAMKKIFSASVQPGEHTIVASLNNEAKADFHTSQSMILTKSKGRDILKITLSSLLRDPKPGIFFDHETVAQ